MVHNAVLFVYLWEDRAFSAPAGPVRTLFSVYRYNTIFDETDFIRLPTGGRVRKEESYGFHTHHAGAEGAQAAGDFLRAG